MITVGIRTDSRYPVNRKIIRRAVVDTIAKHTIGSIDVEVSVVVVGARKMDELSKAFLKDQEEHEVLSFPLEESKGGERGFVNPPDGILRLGDIVLCWPRVLLAAAIDGVMVDDEVFLLTAHSTEHLLGKHHD